MIRYNCGCGFQTGKWDEAEVHVLNTKHTMEVFGRVTYREVCELQVVDFEKVGGTNADC